MKREGRPLSKSNSTSLNTAVDFGSVTHCKGKKVLCFAFSRVTCHRDQKGEEFKGTVGQVSLVSGECAYKWESEWVIKGSG